jgi:hypothetical protein
LRYAGSIIGAGLLGLILSTDATAPSTDVFRLLFAILLVTACLVIFLLLSIQRFVESEGARAKAWRRHVGCPFHTSDMRAVT